MKILKVINVILKTHFGEEEAPPYPSDFGIIDWSPIALRENIRDDQNKIIYRYTYGKLKKYRYSEARLKSLREVYGIPIFDKTKRDAIFPIWAEILPSEVQYTT